MRSLIRVGRNLYWIKIHGAKVANKSETAKLFVGEVNYWQIVPTALLTAFYWNYLLLNRTVCLNFRGM